MAIDLRSHCAAHARLRGVLRSLADSGSPRSALTNVGTVSGVSGSWNLGSDGGWKDLCRCGMPDSFACVFGDSTGGLCHPLPALETTCTCASGSGVGLSCNTRSDSLPGVGDSVTVDRTTLPDSTVWLVASAHSTDPMSGEVYSSVCTATSVVWGELCSCGVVLAGLLALGVDHGLNGT